MPESFVSLLGDLIGIAAAAQNIHCSVETPQLALNDMLGTSCNLAMAAWSSA